VKPITDEIIIGSDMDKKIHLKIKNSGFRQADKIIEEKIKENISQIESDYYLYSFSNDELFEILSKPDEWSKQDYFISKKILVARGVNLSENNISEIQGNRMKEIKKQEKGSFFWIVIGYILSISGIFGFFFGLAYLHAKKILPDGNKVFVYDENTRNHGRNILVVSCVFIIANILTGLGLRGMIF
jgi:hypothetical protein